jgi:hypothetical protein
VLSTHDRANLMASQTAFSFAMNAAGSNPIVVDETQTYQTIDGSAPRSPTPPRTCWNRWRRRLCFPAH